VLAHETYHGRPNNVPSATGATHPVILGKIAHGQSARARGKRAGARKT
jgi:anhydro-N-acetylmuramic acid kinase